MSDAPDDDEPHHHGVRERLDAARAAAEEVVAEESGQLGGEVSALAVPFEEAIAAVGAALHPHRLAEREVVTEPGPADEAAVDVDQHGDPMEPPPAG